MPFIDKEKQREYQREYQRKRRKQEKGEHDTSEDDGEGVASEVKTAIIVTILFALAALSILSFFGLAGILGVYTHSFLVYSFGWGAFSFPILLLVIGGLLLKGVRYSLDKWQMLGVVLIFLSFLGMLHHVPRFEDALSAVPLGAGGGYLGFALSGPLSDVAGYWGAWIFLLVLFVIGALLALNNYFFGSHEDDEKGEQEFVGGNEKTWLARVLQRVKEWNYKRMYDGGNASGKEAPQEEIESSEETKEGEEPDESDEGEAATSLDAGIPVIKKMRRTFTIPLDLLKTSNERPTAENVEGIKEKIVKTFATFGIAVEMDEVNVGPTVTQYTLKPPAGVKLSRLTGLANELALSLAAHPLRMEAPIPGRSLVGIEIPNKSMASVKLRDLIDTPEFKKRTSNLMICLGKDVTGKPWLANLAKMPHLLIAGSTGSGKSVAINSVIISLLYQNSPDDLKLVLVDPKKVELTGYNDIPYLLTPVITDPKKTVNALKWVVGEMERRYQLLSNRGKRNIEAFNDAHKKDSLPYIVFIIDELADLMSVAANDVEGAIVRLAQMARAVGIHLILATQRPSVNVITGLIKANVPTRIAFAVPSQIDSRTIIDSAGAEKLIGRGDMLFLSPEYNKVRRLQGSYLDDSEIEHVVSFLKEEAGEAEYQDEITEHPPKNIQFSGSLSGGDGDEDVLYADAKDEVVRAGKASASLLQRRLRIGYARAARLLDILEQEGVIGPADGARPRDILVVSAEESGQSNEEDFADEAPSEEADESETNDKESYRGIG